MNFSIIKYWYWTITHPRVKIHFHEELLMKLQKSIYMYSAFMTYNNFLRSQFSVL